MCDERTEAIEMGEQIQAAQDNLNALLSGLSVTILSNFNGQPFGRSRPSLKGKTYTVSHAFYDDFHGVCVFVRGERWSIPLREVSINGEE